MTPPMELLDGRTPEQVAEDRNFADEESVLGKVQHFVLRMGYMPIDNKHAEAILTRIILEHEWYMQQATLGVNLTCFRQ